MKGNKMTSKQDAIEKPYKDGWVLRYEPETKFIGLYHPKGGKQTVCECSSPVMAERIITALSEQPSAEVDELKKRNKKLYDELLEQRKKFEILEQRLNFNPDWLQTDEQSKKLFAEIRAEYMEYFDSQQIIIRKWRDKYNALKKGQEVLQSQPDIARVLDIKAMVATFAESNESDDYPFDGEEYDVNLVKFAFDCLFRNITDVLEGMKKDAYTPDDQYERAECRGYNKALEDIKTALGKEGDDDL
jgi:hypothetical protein